MLRQFLELPIGKFTFRSIARFLILNWIEMQASDLMVGNWVFCKGGLGNDYPLEIISINEDTVGTSNYKTESNPQFQCDADCSINEIYGIPLTEEILVKCGFEKANTTGLYGTHINGLRYCFDIETGSVYLDYKEYEIAKDIKYLHELQILFKALTKQELEVKI